MNIAMFSNSIVPPKYYGGIERVIDWLIKELTAMGHRIYFFGPYGSEVPLAAKIFYLTDADGEVSKQVSDGSLRVPEDTDIIHLHGLINMDSDFPVLKTIHGYPFLENGTVCADKSDRFDDYCSFLSNAHRNTCGRPDNPYVYNGLDLNDYIYAEDKDEYFLFLGKVDWNVKGLSIALKIAENQNLKLIIAGDFMDDSFYETELRPRLTKDIQYIGPVGGKEKASLLAKARALIFPTLWHEPFGLVVIEALASGTPVLTFFNGAMPEIMRHGVTGFMAGTEEEMEGQIKYIDQIDPRVCRDHVEKHFTARTMSQNYLRLYNLVIDKYNMQ